MKSLAPLVSQRRLAPIKMPSIPSFLPIRMVAQPKVKSISSLTLSFIFQTHLRLMAICLISISGLLVAIS